MKLPWGFFFVKITQETLGKLREKFGDIEDQFTAATGHSFDTLPESEARYLSSYKPADEIRSRIIAQGRQGGALEGTEDSGIRLSRNPTFFAGKSAGSLSKAEIAQIAEDRLKAARFDVPVVIAEAVSDVFRSADTWGFAGMAYERKIDLFRAGFSNQIEFHITIGHELSRWFAIGDMS